MTRSNGPRYSDDERKERRRAANRKSARKSRFRENVMFFELQETVSRLKEQNEALRADNEKFRKNIILLQSLATSKIHQNETVRLPWSCMVVLSVMESIILTKFSCDRRQARAHLWFNMQEVHWSKLYMEIVVSRTSHAPNVCRKHSTLRTWIRIESFRWRERRHWITACICIGLLHFSYEVED